MVTKLSQDEFHAAVASGASVVDFNATWCGPCKMLAPVLAEISEEMKDQAAFYAVDVDECPSLAQEYKIMSIPAVAVIKDGALKEMSIGFLPKEQIKDFIERNL